MQRLEFFPVSAQQLQLPQTNFKIVIAATSLASQFGAMFLPWYRVGGSKRNSFEMLDAATSFAPGYNTAAAIFEVVWLFLPALGVAGLFFWIAEFRRLGAVITRSVIVLLGLFSFLAFLITGSELGNVVCLAACLAYWAALAILVTYKTVASKN